MGDTLSTPVTDLTTCTAHIGAFRPEERPQVPPRPTGSRRTPTDFAHHRRRYYRQNAFEDIVATNERRRNPVGAYGTSQVVEPTSLTTSPCPADDMTGLMSGENDTPEPDAACCTMQGYRMHQEDRHIMVSLSRPPCNVPFPDTDLSKYLPDGYSLVAVLDGHGGSMVASFVETNLLSVLRATAAWSIVVAAAQRMEEFAGGATEADIHELDTAISSALDAAVAQVDEMLKSTMIEPESITCESPRRSDVDEVSGGSSCQDPPPPPRKYRRCDTEDGIYTGACGTTAVLAVVTPHSVIVANVGDSRASLIARDCSVTVLTRDHKPTDPEERERIERAGGFVKAGRIDGKLGVSRAIGDHRFKKLPDSSSGETMSKVIATPEITVTRRRRGQHAFLVLSCDGVVSMNCQQRLASCLWETIDRHCWASDTLRCTRWTGCDVETLAKGLVTGAFSAGSRDNCSAIIVALGGVDLRTHPNCPYVHPSALRPTPVAAAASEVSPCGDQNADRTRCVISDVIGVNLGVAGWSSEKVHRWLKRVVEDERWQERGAGGWPDALRAAAVDGRALLAMTKTELKNALPVEGRTVGKTNKLWKRLQQLRLGKDALCFDGDCPDARK